MPAAVKEAIEAFQPDAESGFKLDPPKPGETSVLFSWGVRVSYKNSKTDSTDVGWICLGSQACRQNWTLYPLYGGKTSNGTKHLKDFHLVTSDKTQVEINRKRTYEEELEEVKSSQIARQDPKRLRLLLETRDIILTNRPFGAGESLDKKLGNDIMVSPEFRVSLYTKAVKRTLVEIYSSTRREVLMLLKKRAKGVKSITIVVDFWTCSAQHAKYLGVRAVFIDDDWELRSVLLGVRLFNPTYAARMEHGFRGCFRQWMDGIFGHFEIDKSEIFGGMTDGAGDVQRLINEEYKAAWEWCVPHMLNVATKWACGLSDNANVSVNPQLTRLIERMRTTIRQVRDVQQLGTLFETLCELEGTSKAVKLIDYQSHRFLGLIKSLERVLEMWNPLVKYYMKSQKQPASAKAPTTFLLKNDYNLIEQLVSLLKPISILKRISQAGKPDHAKCLLLLFKIRQVTLDPKTPLRHFKSTAIAPVYIPVADLEPTVRLTKELLAKALDLRFFSRYTNAGKRSLYPFVFECQLMLHPTYKDLDDNLIKIVKYCCLQTSSNFVQCEREGTYVKDQVRARVRQLMRDAQRSPTATILEEVDRAFQEQTAGELSMELNDLYSSVSADPTPQNSGTTDAQIEDELHRWSMQKATAVSSVLQYWQREKSQFPLLSQVARRVFAFPMSSAQVERDFGDAGRLVSKERASMKDYTVEMSSFVRANRDLVRLTQIDKIPQEEIRKHIPRFMIESDNPEILPNIFSQRCSVDESEEMKSGI